MNLEDKVKTIKSSLLHLDFPKESFHIIWAEGSIYAVGFEKGLKEWGPLIKEGGFLVVHDDYQNHPDKLQLIRECGYRLLDSFQISHEAWWREYYQPLETYLQELRMSGSDQDLEKTLKKEEDEIKWFKVHKSSSVFYVMQKG